MTSAPSWASVIPPSGAATNAEPSTTRSPFRRSYMRSSGHRAGGTELRDLVRREAPRREALVRMLPSLRRRTLQDRKSVVLGTSVSVRVELGGRRMLNKKIRTLQNNTHLYYDNQKDNQKLQ